MKKLVLLAVLGLLAANTGLASLALAECAGHAKTTKVADGTPAQPTKGS
jgi:hypothetical protein